MRGDRLFPGVMPGAARAPQPVPASWWADVGVHQKGGAALQLYEGTQLPPPRLQVGCFDPYSDDPRLGVQKIALCKYTAKMVVAGTAGQVGQRGCCRAPLGSSLGETWHGGGTSDPRACP